MQGDTVKELFFVPTWNKEHVEDGENMKIGLAIICYKTISNNSPV